MRSLLRLLRSISVPTVVLYAFARELRLSPACTVWKRLKSLVEASADEHRRRVNARDDARLFMGNSRRLKYAVRKMLQVIGSVQKVA
jgi:hypothetical protein